MIGSMRTRYSEDEVAVRDAFFDFFANECPTTCLLYTSDAADE